MKPTLRWVSIKLEGGRLEAVSESFGNIAVGSFVSDLEIHASAGQTPMSQCLLDGGQANALVHEIEA